MISSVCSASHLRSFDMLTGLLQVSLRMWTTALSAPMKLLQQPGGVCLTETHELALDAVGSHDSERHQEQNR